MAVAATKFDFEKDCVRSSISQSDSQENSFGMLIFTLHLARKQQIASIPSQLKHLTPLCRQNASDGNMVNKAKNVQKKQKEDI